MKVNINKAKLEEWGTLPKRKNEKQERINTLKIIIQIKG